MMSMEDRMVIQREKLVTRHNPKLSKIDTASPLTIGNGEFAFTADITGLQTLYDEYKDTLPLCTMSQWGWHTKPVSDKKYEYTLDDLEMTTYNYAGRVVKYPKQKVRGNEEVYDWLRMNPHRLNLGRIGLLYQGREIKKEEIHDINQELHLYQGKITSSFKLHGIDCTIETCCDSVRNRIGVKITSDLLLYSELSVMIKFPYGSPDISASDWESNELHKTQLLTYDKHQINLKRILDKDVYYVSCNSEDIMETFVNQHTIIINSKTKEFSFTVEFSNMEIKQSNSMEYRNHSCQVFENAQVYWKKFWEEGGIVQLNKSKDSRALELERRIILSQYLLAINSCGSTPPQETGLTCNSWYGKMHLEMYFWHCAWAPLWNQADLLERSIPWFIEHIPQARENAARNSYAGSRWPKMIATEGIDCPSTIAPLLVWQQPHIIFMLELMRRQNNSNQDFMEKYWILIKETADFMVDFVVYNEETKLYDIVAPVIPVQECHHPEETKNPTFEVEYWRYALKLALEWEAILEKPKNKKWEEVAAHMACLPIQKDLYLAHENCANTFEEFNIDHPSMLGAYGVLPNDNMNEEVMRETLKKVKDCWKYESLWGWDFAVMAMTATRLHDPNLAIDLILLDTPKNDYVRSGNNRQKLRKDLPLYLPGNGSLLLAISMMVAGYDGCNTKSPGFPEDGSWIVEYENIGLYV